MKVDLREFKAAYLAEVDEHLGVVRQRLVAMEASVRASRPCGRELRDVLRLVHTVKGLSAMVGVEPVVTITHRLETLLRDVERAGGKLPPRAFEAIVDGIAAVGSRVHAVAADKPIAEAPAALLAELDALATEAPEASPADEASVVADAEIEERLSPSEREQLVAGVAAGLRALRVDFVPSKAKADLGLSITTIRERISAIGEIVKVVPLSPKGAPRDRSLLFALVVLTSADDAAVAEAASCEPGEVRELLSSRSANPVLPLVEALDLPDHEDHRDSLRVEVSRVDAALDLLSSLVVTRSRLARAAAALAEAGVNTRELESILAEHARQVRDLRGAILHVRMVAMSAVLDRLPLLVRSLGRTTGKEVRLQVSAGSAELDKTVAERMFPALVHLLRNAVDHGIETTAERLAAGKPPIATIHVTCESDGNRSVDVRVRDDGRGIDRARVAARAGKTAVADDAELLDLLCAPGFSTREVADETSGRGVGMDVVRRVVDGLGGELSVESELGRGTTFVLRLPLTISIVEAFTVRCGESRFAVPVPVVEEIVDVEESRVVSVPSMRGELARMVVRRGASVPLVELAGALGRPLGHHGKQALVVRRTKRDAVAFAVDRVLGQQEVVVRPLVDPLVKVTGVAGSTDLGDGLATLVVDLLGLTARLGRTEAA